MPSQASTLPEYESVIDLPPLEQRVELYSVSWETYQRLAAEIRNPGKRLAYEDHTLEITCLSYAHERIRSVFARFFHIAVEELRIPIASFGATTWALESAQKAIQPDESYYFENESLVRAKDYIDLTVDPPPGLVLEVQNTDSSIDQTGIYATIGVPEVWCFDGHSLLILGLHDRGAYSEKTESQFLPKRATDKIVERCANWKEMDDTTLAKDFRRWMGENLVESR